MMAYREAPPAAGLPFPRKHLALYTALAIFAAALVFVLPLPFFASPEGWRMFREGGSGSFVLLLASFVIAAALVAMSVLAVRGKPPAVLAAVPALLVVVGAFFAAFGMRLAIGAVAGESVEPSVAMRILAEGTAECDVTYIVGCICGGTAFGAASMGLLGNAASVDRGRAGAPTGNAWIASLVIGIVDLPGAFAARHPIARHPRGRRLARRAQREARERLARSP
jgi:hypothetical protein